MNAWIPEGRTMHRVKVPRQDGSRVERSTGTRDRNTARKIDLMVQELGRKELRAWDILEAVTASPPRLALSTLWDWWVSDNRDLTKIRARIADEDLAVRIPGWLDRVRLDGAADDTLAHYEHAVRTLADKAGAIARSSVTPARVNEWLASRTMVRYELVAGKRTPKDVPLSTGAKRKYYAALSSFLSYLRSIAVVQGDLLADVATPAAGAPRDRHLETAEVLQLVDVQAEPYRTIAAIGAGAGIESSVILGLRAADVDVAHEEIRARGTKTLKKGPWRDRVCKVATWAWPIIEAHLVGLKPRDLLFPDVDRWKVLDSHHAGCAELEIRDYAFRDHRHTWAVRAVKAGTPLEIVARQLGHKDATLVVKVYARYVPKQEEREKWEKIAAAQDAASAPDSGSHSGSQRGAL
jgi:integrase